ncbi:MAG: thiamine diphosphokinase [Holosporales bacterium]|jgi:thiamine pyrophosphokinase|nr:thiamine diphosphokinase [Holosporales bacterium]
MRVLFIAHGACEESLPAPKDFDRVIAVDGGGNYAHRAGILPHVVIGDEDSLQPDLQQQWRKQGISFFLFPTDKDQTDLEIALLWAQERGMTEGVVYGALGNRLDQSMANMALLADARFVDLSLIFIQGNTRVQCLRSQMTLAGHVDNILSLLAIDPVSPPLITLKGFQYSLEKAPLLSPTHGISNRIIQSPAHIFVHKGAVFVFHTEQ